jgi:hypothetical protein
MKKLELKNIAGYLPHNLYVQCPFKGRKRICSIYSVRKGNMNYLIDLIEIRKDKVRDELHAVIYEIKPILRPLDDLCRTITHNGKEIIPIVEIGKLCLDISDDIKVLTGDYGSAVFGKKYVKSAVFCLQIYKDMTLQAFSYKPDKYGNPKNKQYMAIKNTDKFFDFLHELKIDYRNLIDDGLAIDCNTLEVSPYK